MATLNNDSSFIALLQGRLNVAAVDRTAANKRTSERRAAKRQEELGGLPDYPTEWVDLDDDAFADWDLPEGEDNGPADEPTWLGIDEDTVPERGAPDFGPVFDTPEWLRNIHAEYVSDAELAETRARLAAEEREYDQRALNELRFEIGARPQANPCEFCTALGYCTTGCIPF